MSAQALYRKWRPQTFDAVVGQEHVTHTLRNALRSGRTGHAYLFAGPRGTGKTTTARLLAKAVNCLAENPNDRPCNACAICQALNEGRLLDLIEIDAASNRGIDEIRELRQRVGFRPNEARYKIYVVDECHMLTEPAFNALLKTLEEPPPHVIFVLATTEPHKIPETILSRCQRFDFRRLTVNEIVGRLTDLAAREGLQLEPEALTAVARQATGSLRDAESLLDQLIVYSDETITLKRVQTVLGTGSLQIVSEVVAHLVAGDVASGLDAINRAIDEGVAPGQLNRQVVEYLRALMLLQVSDGDRLLNLSPETLETMRNQAAQISLRQVVRSVKLFNEAGWALKGSLHQQLPLELAFIEAVKPGFTQSAIDPSAQPTNQSPSRTSETRGTPSSPRTRPAPLPSVEQTTPPANSQVAEPKPTSVQPSVKTSNVSLETVRLHWAEILGAIRPQSRSVEALLRSGHPASVEGNTVVIGFAHAFHKRKVEEAENRQLIEGALKQVLGQGCQVRCELVSQRPSQRTASPGTSPPLSEPDRAGAAASETLGADRYQQVAQDPVIQAAVEELGAQVVDVSDDE
jgi:DNA polymerase-3 subunit gamma/tau